MAAGGEPAVDVRGAVKTFGAVRALDGVGLRVNRGEIYGLLGPNGAGKTTLIRCLLGLVRPEQGSVRVLGRPPSDLDVLGRIGYVTQAPALYADLTVLENVRFFADISGRRDDGVEDALRFVHLEDRRGTVVAELSGGMQRRVSLACALAHRPELLLLDEPTVGVDPQLRHEMWDGFRALADRGTTILVSSHVMDEAERCERLGLLLSGRLLAEGTSAELRERAGTPSLEDAFIRLSTDSPDDGSPR